MQPIPSDGTGGAPSACPTCSAIVDAGNRFCTQCGARMDAATDAPAPVEPAIAPLVHGRGAARYAAKQSGKSVGRARKVLVVLAVVFVFAGSFLAPKNAREIADLKENLASTYAADDVIEMDDGTEWVVSDLLVQLDREAFIPYVIYFGLAVVMGSLYFWARRSPFPAMLTALCVYLAMMVGGAILDPASLLAGLLVKVLVILALLAGVRSALAERVQAGDAEPPPAA